MAKLFLALDVDFDDDEKVARLARYTKPGEARACRDLLVAMWRYCKRERSDGKVPAEVVGKLVYPDSPRLGIRDADRLVEIGIAERTPDGYYLPTYLKRNKSRAQLEEEAKVKAEAGRKGGVASGQSRKGQADGKQGASSVLHQDEAGVLQPSEAIDRDIDTDRDKGSKELGGNRPEPLRAVPAPEPPDNGEHCIRHPNGNPTDEPCRGCQAAEARRQKRAERNIEKARLATEKAARECTRCDGVWVLDDNKMPTRTKCTNHRRTA